MFEKNGQIYKADGRNTFIDVQQAFGIEKICFQFRNYDQSRQAGNRITAAVDFYMDMHTASYFAMIMRTGDIWKMAQRRKQEAAAKGRNFPDAAFSAMGGTTKEGRVISRQIRVEGGDRKPIIMKAFQGPGVKDEKGLIVPQYKFNEAEEKIMIGLDMRQCAEIGLAIERAINIYDIWVAIGTLDKNLERLKNWRE